MKIYPPSRFTLYVLRSTFYVLLLTAYCILLTACNSSTDTPTPGLNQTQAYETVVARITEVSQELASQTVPTTLPSDSGQPTLTPTPPVSDTPLAPTGAASTFTPSPTVAAATCDRADGGFPIDVTIPDDTQFAPGTAFVKTWRLVNVGSCPWTTGYSLVYFSGEKMGGPDVVPLGGDVAPGQSVDLSVNLTAPANPGTYQGNWMLKNPSGVLFGIGPEGNSFFWVRIIVPGGSVTASITPSMTPNGSATVTPTPNGSATPTATLTPAPGSTPIVLVNSSIAILPDTFVDLDTGATNGGSSNDLSYTTDQNATHLLTPLGGAAMGIFSTQTPTLDNCRAAGLGSGTLTVENLTLGTYICYRTEQGHYGWLRLDNFDPSSSIMSLTLLTWQ